MAAPHTLQERRLFVGRNALVDALLKKRQPTPRDVQGRVDAYPSLRHEVSQAVIEYPIARLVCEPAMHDDVEPGVNDHAHGLVRAAVRRGEQPPSVPLFGDGLQLFAGKGRAKRVRPQRTSARRHHLEEVRALLDELTRRPSHAFRAIRLRAHEPAVPTGGGNRSAGGEHAGTAHETLANALLQAEGRLVPGAAVAHGRHPRFERMLDVVRRAQQAEVIVVVPVDVLTASSVPWHVRVRMAID